MYETLTVDPDGRAIGTAQGVTTTQKVTVTAVAAAADVLPSSAAPALNAKLVTVPSIVEPVSTAIAVVSTTPAAPVVVPTTSAVAPVVSVAAQSSVPATSAAISSSSGSSASLAIEAGSVANPLSQGVSPSATFQDGYYKCTDFPAAEPGILNLDYLGHGGYTGIQNGEGTSQLCDCEGCLCSYSCQPGMMKTQWPVDQPADGESRGGLVCKGGLLYRSDTSKSALCQWGKLTAIAKNSLSNSVAICQTDYPGSENMVLPTFVRPQSSEYVAVVDEANYYQWQGKLTSSQFYVNNQGVGQEAGCQWGSPGSNIGNYAPVNFGAGYVDGVTYMSIIANPNTNTVLNFNVGFYALDGSTLNGDCKYENGVYLDTAGNKLGIQNGCTVTCSGTCGWNFY